jgi:hypothetical protein
MQGFQLSARKQPFCIKTAILAEKTLDSSARIAALTSAQSLY